MTTIPSTSLGQRLIAETLPQQLMRLDSERLRRYQQHLDFYQGRQCG